MLTKEINMTLNETIDIIETALRDIRINKNELKEYLTQTLQNVDWVGLQSKFEIAKAERNAKARAKYAATHTAEYKAAEVARQAKAQEDCDKRIAEMNAKKLAHYEADRKVYNETGKKPLHEEYDEEGRYCVGFGDCYDLDDFENYREDSGYGKTRTVFIPRCSAISIEDAEAERSAA
jgi:hypothetical protein